MAPPKGHPNWGGRPKGAKSLKNRARDAGKTRALKLAEITAERVMLEIARVGVSDIGVLFDESSKLRPVKDLPPDARAAVASIKTLKTNVVSGDGQQEETREVKLWDKLSALNLLAKHFGLVTDKVELSVAEPLLAKLDQIKAKNRTKDGK